MKSIIYLIGFLFLYSGCSEKVESLTCSDVINDYNKYTYLKGDKYFTLNAVQGKRRVVKNIFIFDESKKFNNEIDKYIENIFINRINGVYDIAYPNIDRKCSDINSILKDRNITTIQGKLNYLKENWKREYSLKIKNELRGKINFREFSGCIDNATALQDAFNIFIGSSLDKEKNFQIFQERRRGYEDCLRGSIKRSNLKKEKKRNKINEK